MGDIGAGDYHSIHIGPRDHSGGVSGDIQRAKVRGHGTRAVL
jgi:hypothetical protein